MLARGRIRSRAPGLGMNDRVAQKILAQAELSEGSLACQARILAQTQVDLSLNLGLGLWHAVNLTFNLFRPIFSPVQWGIFPLEVVGIR